MASFTATPLVAAIRSVAFCRAVDPVRVNRSAELLKVCSLRLISRFAKSVSDRWPITTSSVLERAALTAVKRATSRAD